MDKRKVGLIAAIVMGLLAVLLLNQYLAQQKAKVTAPTGQETQVLVAARHIPRGQTIEPGMVALKKFPNEWVQPGALTSTEDVIGKLAYVDISQGEQILTNKLTTLQGSRTSSLSMRTPPGKRAITILIDALSAVGGMVRPGDYVDVIGNFPIPQMVAGKQEIQMVTVTLFQNVLVLAVGQEYAEEEEGQRSPRGTSTSTERTVPSTITLALSPQEAELISFAQEQGKLKLILRPPLDTATHQLPVATWDVLLQYILSSQGKTLDELYQQPPIPAEEASPEPESKPKESEIDIYRGSGKR